jgi:hypothetical protein
MAERAEISHTPMHTDAQVPSTRRLPRTAWPPGKSANPSGKTKAQIRTAEFMQRFRDVHGRAPGVVEATQVRAAGALAARVESHKTKVDDQVRCANVLARLLSSLGLDRTPAPAAPKTPVQNLEEACALIREGQR